jgi:hypothetical protein
MNILVYFYDLGCSFNERVQILIDILCYVALDGDNRENIASSQSSSKVGDDSTSLEGVGKFIKQRLELMP